MNNEKIFLGATGQSLVRAERVDGRWEVSTSLQSVKINSLIKDPKHPQRIYIGTQTQGVQVSNDTGLTWNKIGLENIPVKALAIDPQKPQRMYAGCKPVALYMTDNYGQSWSELEALRMTRKWWWFSPADPPGMEGAPMDRNGQAGL